MKKMGIFRALMKNRIARTVVLDMLNNKELMRAIADQVYKSINKATEPKKKKTELEEAADE